jgi:hypothetical protein
MAPLAIRLKNDRLGLGIRRGRKKVTHSAEEIEKRKEEVKKQVEPRTRRDHERQLERDRRRSAALLRYLNQPPANP